MMLIQYFPTNTKFPFMRFRRWSFPCSAAMSVLAVLLYFFVGMNFGIDFKGGTLVEMQAKGQRANAASLRERAD
ncbi:MAG TPA: protein translocase subunit SecF, partial [Beijerinckiaceae bacterium]|nr:protein translocase subunit SecF [Beijerinckiaceae bacterium]